MDVKADAHLLWIADEGLQEEPGDFAKTKEYYSEIKARWELTLDASRERKPEPLGAMPLRAVSSSLDVAPLEGAIAAAREAGVAANTIADEEVALRRAHARSALAAATAPDAA
eukprot:3547514-Prymnesium_polylepis.1